MSKVLEVKLSGVPCGEVTQSSEGNLLFNYRENYPTTATPVSLSMPVGFLRYSKATVMPFLQGLLPDNQNALTAIAKRFGVSPNNPFALVQMVGAEVAGALEFFDSGVEPHMTSNSAKLLSPELVAQMLQEKLNEYEDGTLTTAAPENLSLAGAQPKLVLHRDNEGNWLVPDQAQLSTHILKPVPTRWKNLDIVEHQTMVAASKLGLKVARTEITTLAETPVFITERYDRKMDSNGVLVRVHQEDFCQALSVAPSKKYQRDDGGPGVGEIAKLIRESVRKQDQAKVAEEFFRGLVFNVLAMCTDAHAKNYSVMLDGQRVELAPLYDLSSTVLFGLPLKSAMSINQKYRFDEIGLKDLLFEAGRLGLDRDWAQTLIEKMNSNLLQAFSEAGQEIRQESNHANIARTTNELVDSLADFKSSSLG